MASPSQPLLHQADLRFQFLDLHLRLGRLLSAGLQLCGDGDEREEEEERGEDGREGDWDVVRPGDDAHVAPRSARLRVERRWEENVVVMSGRSRGVRTRGGFGAGHRGRRTSSRSSGYSGTPIISAARVSPASDPLSFAPVFLIRCFWATTSGRDPSAPLADRDGRGRDSATPPRVETPMEDVNVVIADTRLDRPRTRDDGDGGMCDYSYTSRGLKYTDESR